MAERPQGRGTWLSGLPRGETDWERVAACRPEAFSEVAALYRAGWEATDPVLLELCRLRLATLFGYAGALRFRSEAALAAGLDEAHVAGLAGWPTSPRYSARERACLAFAEQIVLDPKRVDDALVGALLEQLSPTECYAFVRALWAVEALHRVCLVLGADPDPAPFGLVAHRPAA